MHHHAQRQGLGAKPEVVDGDEAVANVSADLVVDGAEEGKARLQLAVCLAVLAELGGCEPVFEELVVVG